MLQPIFKFLGQPEYFSRQVVLILYVRVGAGTQAQKNARHFAVGAA